MATPNDKFSPQSQDNLGPYPTKVDVPGLEARRYIWTARAFAIAFYISMILNIVLVAVIFNLVPLKRVEPMLVTFSDKADQIVKIEPFSKGTRGFELMTEALAKEYVTMREEVLLNTEVMADRWGRLVRFRSSSPVYNRFVEEKQPLLEQAKRNQITRTTKILSVNKFGQRSLRVEFEATDTSPRLDEPRRTTYEVIMQIAFIPQQVSFEDRYVNPLGFTVTKYSIREKFE